MFLPRRHSSYGRQIVCVAFREVSTGSADYKRPDAITHPQNEAPCPNMELPPCKVVIGLKNTDGRTSRQMNGGKRKSADRSDQSEHQEARVHLLGGRQRLEGQRGPSVIASAP